MPTDRKPLTLDVIYAREGAIDFDGDYAKDVRWVPDSGDLVLRTDERVVREDARTGVRTVLWEHATLVERLVEVAAIDECAAKAAVKAARPQVLTGGGGVVALLPLEKAVYLLDVRDETLRALVDTPATREEVALSPGGRWLTYVQEGDLYVVDVAAASELRITEDGSGQILNGRLDWVYQEEIYGRDNWRGYWWREDERYLAFVRLDCRAVPEVTITDDRTQPPRYERYRYPKPGEANPAATLAIADALGRVRWIRFADEDAAQTLIVRVDWGPDGHLYVQVQDRAGRWLELRAVYPGSGASRVVLRETSPAWVNSPGKPVWLQDGSFLWRSERDGWAHVYHFEFDGRLRRRVTSGQWEARQVHRLSADERHVFITGTADGPLENHVYRVALADGTLERLTALGSSHAAQFSDDATLFVDTYSNVVTPPRVAVVAAADGELTRQISANPVPALGEYVTVTPEFRQIPSDTGFAMNVQIYQPPDFDPTRRYPVIVETYAGPHAPCVHNRWGGKNGMFRQLAVQRGFVYVLIDPETASGCGAVSAWKCYRRLGQRELADLEAALRQLAAYDWVDAERIALNGWSYGGFFTAYALTHSTLLKVGLAGAPVTDWRLYDSVYTERFMQTPAENPEGYAASSVVAAAAQLSGRLLLVHGAIDDNVHVQNTLQLAYALQQAERQFDLMIYPGNRHGVKENVRHWAELRLSYLEAHL